MLTDYQKPWHKQANESGKNYHNFLHFLHLQPFERSMDRAYSQHQWVCLHKDKPAGDKPTLLTCSGLWNELRFKHSWVERCDAYDMELAEVERLHKIQRIKEMNERHVQIALSLQTLAANRLQQFVQSPTLATMTPSQIAGVLDKASTVERRAMGEATSILAKAGDDANAGLALDLSKLDAQELQVFQALVNKAKPGAALPEHAETPVEPAIEVMPTPTFAHTHKAKTH